MKSSFILLVIVSALCQSLPAADNEPLDEPSAAAISSLIKQLGANDWRQRVDAQRRLIEASDRAAAQLASAPATADPEVRQRIELIQARIEREMNLRQERSYLRKHYSSVLGVREFSKRSETHAIETKDRTATVEAALNWLAANQEDDGCWNSLKHGAEVKADLAQTALAILTFNGAGHTVKVGKHKAIVKKGVDWLLAQMRADGAFMSDGKPVDGFAQACAGMALCESCGMTRKHSDEAQKVCDYSLSAFQCKDGGFSATANTNNADLLATVVFMLHLKSGKVAGLKVQTEEFQGIVHCTDTLFDAKHNAYRLSAGVVPSGRATYFAILCRQFCGVSSDELHSVFETARRMEGEPSQPDGDVLCDWISALTAFQVGGEFWQEFDEARNVSASRQKNAGAEAGSFAPEGEWSGAGRVFQTTLRTLSFEIYSGYIRLRQ
jgi:hypothetical protein